MKTTLKAIAGSLMMFIATAAFSQTAPASNSPAKAPANAPAVSTVNEDPAGNMSHSFRDYVNAHPDLKEQLIKQDKEMKAQGMSKKQIDQALKNTVKQDRRHMAAEHRQKAKKSVSKSQQTPRQRIAGKTKGR